MLLAKIVDLVFFFVRFDFLAVIHVDSKIKWLVLDLLSAHFGAI